MNSLVLGRYVPHNSFIHKMDARNKIVCLILLMVAIFLNYSTEMSFIILGALATLILVFLFISKVSIIDIFKSLRVLWFFIILLMIINVFAPPANSVNVAFMIGNLPIYWEAILQSLKIILRLVLMIELTMILTATTTPLELTYGLEWFMNPLKVIKFPAHEVAMTISIALRFIPTLLDETDRIMKAQSSRGVDFIHGKFSSRLKAIISLIIPLFISAFQRSEELADSMEARGYDPKAPRTKYRVLKFNVMDLLTFLLILAIFSGTLVLSITNWNLSTPNFSLIYVISLGAIFIVMLAFGVVEQFRGRKL